MIIVLENIGPLSSSEKAGWDREKDNFKADSQHSQRSGPIHPWSLCTFSRFKASHQKSAGYTNVFDNS